MIRHSERGNVVYRDLVKLDLYKSRGKKKKKRKKKMNHYQSSYALNIQNSLWATDDGKLNQRADGGLNVNKMKLKV